MIAGDAVYAGVHPWLAETNKERRQGWLQNLKTFTELNPRLVIAGHSVKPDDISPTNLSKTRSYILDFDKLVVNTVDTKTLQTEMLKKYPHLALPIILQYSADAVFNPHSH